MQQIAKKKLFCHFYSRTVLGVWQPEDKSLLEIKKKKKEPKITCVIIKWKNVLMRLL